MKGSPSATAMLVQIFALMPLFLGGVFLALDSHWQLADAEVFSNPDRCVVDVQYVDSLSRTGDPLYVVTDGGDCGQDDQYYVDYASLPVSQRVSTGDLPIELGRTPDGTVVARPADVPRESTEVLAILLRVGVGLAAVGAVLELFWLRHVWRVRR